MGEMVDREHAASPRRRQQARQRGYVPRSREFVFALVYAAVALTVVAFGPILWRMFGERLRHDLSAAGDPLIDPLAFLQLWIVQGLWWVFPWVLAMGLAAGLGHWLQHGPLWLPDQARWDLERLNPARGLQRLIQPANVLGLLFGTAKLVILCALAGWLLRANWNALLSLSLADAELLAPRAALLLARCGAWLGTALLVWGALDFAWQLFRYERGLRMSPEELREEVQSVHNDVASPRRRR
jgi:type III secretion protein U